MDNHSEIRVGASSRVGVHKPRTATITQESQKGDRIFSEHADGGDVETCLHAHLVLKCSAGHAKPYD